LAGSDRKGTSDCADEVTLSRKGAKSRTRVGGLRSKKTKAGTQLDRLRASNADLKKKLAEARWSSRPRPQRYCRSFRARPGNWSRCSGPCWKTPCAFAEQSSARSTSMMEKCLKLSNFSMHRRRGPVRPSAVAPLGRVRNTKQVVHIADCTADQAYIDGDPLFVTTTDLSGVRTLLVVPCLRTVVA
jgi:hypothetical protein